MSPDNGDLAHWQPGASAAQCVHEIFEAHAAATPGALAVASDSGQLTYAELDARADRLAWRLVQAGVRCGSLVGIHLERGTEMVVAILATLKAGAGYLMLDRAFPAERLRDMVRDVRPVVLVADSAADVEQLGSPAGLVAADSGDCPALPHGAAGAGRESVACVIFTSGSTGRPKAVAAPHRAIVSTIVGQHYTRFGPDTVWLQCAPISWDAFALELWGPLLSGGACVIHPGSPDPLQMARLVARYGITTMDLPTVLFHVIMEVHPAVFAPLRDLLTGGEVLSPELAGQLVREFPHLRFVNGYGPVESMVFVTTHQVTASSAARPSVPIGRSMAGKHVHVLDERLRPVADGEVGELYCSGEGLASGYLGRPALTAQRFVANPFGPPGGRMYRTGDLVRWHTDAPLEFVGRVNEQVKILGASVDLAEVEQALQAHPGVGAAVVVSTGDRSDERRLVAYVTARRDVAAELSEADLYDYAAAKMPNFMVPSRFTIVDSLPRTHNGKVDRTALAERDAAVTEPNPTTPIRGGNTVSQGSRRITGIEAKPEFFRLEERSEFDPKLVLDVLHGRSLGVIFRDVIPADAQKESAERFWSSPARRHREGEPSHIIGSYHWNKSTETYLAETAAIADAVRDVLDVPDSPWHFFRSELGAELAREGAQLRIAEHAGAQACPALIRAWDKEGSFALEPHEDEAQCRDPRQAGFEIQHAPDYEVCAVNMCVEQGEGGRLVIWNIRPDAATRQLLGIEHTGFSYPGESLTEFGELRIDVRQGDLYVFNGAFVHAVDTTTGNRTIVSFLMGFIDDRTVVSWT